MSQEQTIVKDLVVTNAGRLRIVLETFAALDEIRWQDAGNYNLLNYSRDDLSPDEKLLTHWLCYITDRQTPFQRVWDIGGYVLSDLVRTYTAKRQRSVRDLLWDYVGTKGEHLRLECEPRGENDRLRRHGLAGPRVHFASRYMPEDLVLIYRTLSILDAISGRSFPRYLADVIHAETDLQRCIRRMAVALNDLTYAGGGAVKAERLEAALSRTDEQVAGFRISSGEESGLFSRKRLWCSLRDYLKSPEFNREFVAGLAAAGSANSDNWKRSAPALVTALPALELPGDVWNNAPVFRSGLFSPCLQNEPRTWDMPRTIRRVYHILTEQGPIRFYPEQLDVTFDFVPRMCERQTCEVCLFGAGISDVCHAVAGRLCSVALLSCGYKRRCAPGTCQFKDDRVRGVCRSSLATL